MLARLLLVLCLLLGGSLAAAQDVSTANEAIQALTEANRGYRETDAAFNTRIDSTERRALLDRANGIARSTGANVAILTDQMALVDARIAQLGPPPVGIVEAPDIQAQRRQLAQARSSLDSAIKRGKLTGVEAQQLATEISDSAADAVSERLSAHTPSPLTPRFWRLFVELAPRDARRLGLFVQAEGRTIGAAITRRAAWPAIVGTIVALALLFPLRWALTRIGRTVMIERAPASRLRRSGLALWIALVGTVLPGFAALAFVGGLQSAGMIAPSWTHSSNVLVRVSFVAGALVALGTALLQPRLASWRLPPIGDAAAIALRGWTKVAAGVVMTTALVSVLVSEAGSNGPLATAVNGACVALDLALVIGVLRTIGRLRRAAEVEADDRTDASTAAGGAGIGIVTLLAWVAILIALSALAAGYFALALTIARLLIWWPLVSAALYLMLLATDDLATGLVARNSRMGGALVHGFGVRGSLIDQAGVFMSAIVRLLLIALAISVATGPFGSNVNSLFDIATQVSAGLTVGQITISPGAILRGLAVLAAGLFVVRIVQHWLIERYLPATELDAGARNSVAMVARYAGIILAALWALASLGIGIERIALLLSALSVGIGFGLQAITQNFVSGLILLAERPVKIGDWVRVGTDEGDVKRISVRATEIQIADKSTLIVPNSELITKAVLNKTLSDPMGRIQLQFSLILGADVAHARALLLGIYADIPAVLDDPVPVVFIDSIADGRVAFNSFAYVRSPRDVYPTRSAILFRLLADLPAAGIELGTAPQQMQILASDGPRPAQD